MANKFKTYPETAPFVEALRIVLQAEDKVLEGIQMIYGEGVGEGDRVYSESPLSQAFTALKDKINLQIGTTFELGLSGLLGDKKEEGVC